MNENIRGQITKIIAKSDTICLFTINTEADGELLCKIDNKSISLIDKIEEGKSYLFRGKPDTYCTITDKKVDLSVKEIN